MSFLLGLRLIPRSPDVAVAVRNADAAGLTFVSFDDAFAGDGPRLDAVDVAAFLGPQTSRIGLVPTLTTTHTEPFHLATATQTLDLVSRGRAGFCVDVSLDPEAAAATGRRPAPTAEAAWAEAVDVVAAVRALWDSWEDDAEIRDAATSRFLDRAKLHYVDVTVRGTDASFTVKGPSIVPRPPQGQPVVVARLRAGARGNDPRWALAVTQADVVIVDATDIDQELADTVAALRAATPARILAGLASEAPHALARRIAGWSGLDGAEIGGNINAATLVAELHDRGVSLAAGGPTFRDRLGLPRPVDRYAGASS